MQISSHTPALATALLALALLSACNPQPDPAADPAPEAEETSATEAPSPEPTESVSILRPDIDPNDEPDETPLEPLRVTIGFPEGGSELDANAIAALEDVLASEQLTSGLPITLGAHSDSAGSDEVNLDSSEARGLAVAKWLIDQGVNADRLTVIAFGEQNPAQPNALPDGAPNEEGRAANRRVELLIDTSIEVLDAPAVKVEDGASVEAGD